MVKRSVFLILLMMLGWAWMNGFCGVEADDPAGPVAEPRAADVAAATQSQTAPGVSWEQIMESGGWLMVVLAGLSVLTVAFIVYFLVVLRAAQIVPRRLHRDLVEKIGKGDMDEARRTCEYRPCPLSSVVLAVMNYARSVPNADPVFLKDVTEGEGARQADNIQGQTQYLRDIATIAPMVGLLGTVFGMLRAFSAVALDIANAKPVALAGGVSLALVTTAFGLIIGIPAMMSYSYFRRRASKLVSLLESASTDVLTAFLGRRAR